MPLGKRLLKQSKCFDCLQSTQITGWKGMQINSLTQNSFIQLLVITVMFFTACSSEDFCKSAQSLPKYWFLKLSECVIRMQKVQFSVQLPIDKLLEVPHLSLYTTLSAMIACQMSITFFFTNLNWNLRYFYVLFEQCLISAAQWSLIGYFQSENLALISL